MCNFKVSSQPADGLAPKGTICRHYEDRNVWDQRVTKPPVIHFSVKEIESYSYLPGATTAQLEWHVKHARGIQQVTGIFMILKNCGNNRMEERPPLDLKAYNVELSCVAIIYKDWI